MSENVVIGGTYCPYCRKVKDYFETNKIPFKWVDVETEEGEQERITQSAKYNWKTIPLVFVQGEFIGGSDDFFKALKENKVNFGSL